MPIPMSSTEQVLRHHGFEFRIEESSDDGPGGGRGVACVMGVMDAYRSVWSPKAFGKPVLATFLNAGFISDSHSWEDHLATIDDARVTNNELRIGWTWYSTDDAQEMRTKCKERMERKKTVGLSIGASVNWSKCADFDSGEKLWTYAEGLGEDMSLYDPSIRKHKGYCWIIPEVTRLYETAITLAPAVPGSQQTEARSIDDLLHSEALGALAFGDHLDRVLGAVQGIEARSLEIEAFRAANTGRIGRDNLQRIVALRDSLTNLIGRSSQSTPPQVNDTDYRIEQLLASRRIAQLRG